jgi:predicted secreted hydrolase
MEFPRDHANHPEFRLESWTFAANLRTKEGRAFACQVRFVRAGLNFKPDNASRWAVRDLFFTQWTITDENGGRFLHGDRINRAGIGWAGAANERMRVWNEDWEASETPQGGFHVQAAEKANAIELNFDRRKPAILHGENGLVQKGEFSINATQFYSLSRMHAQGAVIIDGQRFDVDGMGWFDHEFGASAEEKEQQGWDRLALQFEDGSDLLVFRFRNLQGQATGQSFATWISPEGAVQKIKADQFRLDSNAQWTSKDRGATYPAEFRLQIPSRSLDITLRPRVAEQEIRGAEAAGGPFWTGSIHAQGQIGGRAAQGHGRMELTGYR